MGSALIIEQDWKAGTHSNWELFRRFFAVVAEVVRSRSVAEAMPKYIKQKKERPNFILTRLGPMVKATIGNSLGEKGGLVELLIQADFLFLELQIYD